MQLVNKKFYNIFVQVTASIVAQRGCLATGDHKDRLLAMSGNTCKDMLVLRLPKQPFMGEYKYNYKADYTQTFLDKRTYWSRMKWDHETFYRITRKKSALGNSKEIVKKPFNFSKVH